MINVNGLSLQILEAISEVVKVLRRVFLRLLVSEDQDEKLVEQPYRCHSAAGDGENTKMLEIIRGTCYTMWQLFRASPCSLKITYQNPLSVAN